MPQAGRTLGWSPERLAHYLCRRRCPQILRVSLLFWETRTLVQQPREEASQE